MPKLPNALSRRAAPLVLLLGALPPPAAAQTPRVEPGGTVALAPGPQYEAGWIHRLFFGSHYRDLWTTPIEAPVLDLDTYAGGLRATRKGGGQQTKSLRLRGADGKEYQIRSIDKDPVQALPPALR
jgi:hypothetical protein